MSEWYLVWLDLTTGVCWLDEMFYLGFKQEHK